MQQGDVVSTGSAIDTRPQGRPSIQGVSTYIRAVKDISNEEFVASSWCLVDLVVGDGDGAIKVLLDA